MLPFNGLKYPSGVAVGTDGGFYVADHGNQRVLKLSADESSQTVLPFPTGPDGLRAPNAVAVAKDGTVYVSDCYYPNRVWKLPAGSNTPIVLLDNTDLVQGLAVDSAGNLYGSFQYGTDFSRARVWKLPAPTTPNVTPTTLPFTGLKGPLGVAVDSVDNVYVVDDYYTNDPQKTTPTSEHRVVRLSADLTTQTDLPFTGFNYPWGVAVDNAGSVYVTDGDYPDNYLHRPPDAAKSRVVKLATGSSTQTVLPFTDLNRPDYVAVRPPWMSGPPDRVYVSDTLANRVVGLGLG